MTCPTDEKFDCEWVYQNNYGKNLNVGLIAYAISFIIIAVGTFLLASVVVAFLGLVLGIFSSSYLNGYAYMFNLHYNKKDSLLPFSLIYTVGNILMVLWIILLI